MVKQIIKTYIMDEKDNIVRVYTGSALKVNLLKDELEQKGIAGLIQNDFQSGVAAGFAGGLPSAIDLFIQESDLKKAEPVIQEFIQRNQ